MKLNSTEMWLISKNKENREKGHTRSTKAAAS